MFFFFFYFSSTLIVYQIYSLFFPLLMSTIINVDCVCVCVCVCVYDCVFFFIHVRVAVSDKVNQIGAEMRK